MDNELKFIYLNWKGEVSKRKVIPEKLWYGSTTFHTDEQWFLLAFDVEKKEQRDFAIKDIIKWL